MYWNFGDILRGPDTPPFRDTDGPLAVEIGFGNGEFLERLAAERPGYTVVGMEISQWCIAKGARRALAGRLENIRLVWGDARYLLKYAFDGECVSEVFMNCPCPWPKRRHAERRVARREFADLLASRLVLSGTFTLVTDVDWYAAETRDVFAAAGTYEAGPVTRIQPRGFSTKYERKWLGMGRDIYEVRAKKKKSAVRGTSTQKIREELETMESAESLLAATTALNEESFRDLVRSLEGNELENSDYKVVFREVFFGAGMSALVKVISIDEGFEQHYRVKIVHADGRLRAKTDSVGHPYRTPGVRASLRHVTRKTGAEL
ncbi:MAG: tRNA (guanosine(46)-N7)-methyltransferase TrmB [Synergistaceae bacterium]|jgi:tRNA (guanine-N7-)-methyltransferase|nr:tRNA (guanosine(46)-N7)-methyltransferase TrmB [Synergistaceae bacterium]